MRWPAPNIPPEAFVHDPLRQGSRLRIAIGPSPRPNFCPWITTHSPGAPRLATTALRLRERSHEAADRDDGGVGPGPAIATGLALAALRCARTQSSGPRIPPLATAGLGRGHRSGTDRRRTVPSCRCSGVVVRYCGGMRRGSTPAEPRLHGIGRCVSKSARMGARRWRQVARCSGSPYSMRPV